MNALLVGLNAKYIHTNLAIRNIVKYCDDPRVNYFEATVNDDMDMVMEDILDLKPKVIGFSCYIWNIEAVLYMVENIKKVDPDKTIVLGGPEVSFDALEVLRGNPGVDFIIAGEGERAFRDWLEAWLRKRPYREVKGLAYREGGNVHKNGPQVPLDLNDIGLSYGVQENLEHKLVYYETSRGCPFKCTFCLSSLDPGVRTADLSKVSEDLKYFIDKKVKTVKLVDRSFNCNLKRAEKLFDIIKSLPGETIFHCEINPELVTDEFISSLGGIEDRLQFEVGVQSTNPKTLRAIKRTDDVPRTLRGIELMRAAGLKLHIDLIAGLPHEDISSFGKSFNDVYDLGPDVIQLGFLKMLKGTELTSQGESYGIEYRSKPPYEILYNDYISYEELGVLKGIEDLVDKYYNSGRFKNTLRHMANSSDSPFDFFMSLRDYWKTRGLFRARHSLRTLYDLLHSYALYIREDEGLVQDLLKFDYLFSVGKDALPESIERKETPVFLNRAKDLMRDDAWRTTNFPGTSGLSWGQMSRATVFGLFRYDVLGDKSLRDHGMVFFRGADGVSTATFEL